MPQWSKVRNRYPALKEYVYLDTAATGVMSTGTSQAAVRVYTELALHGNAMLKSWLDRMKKARRAVAALIGASMGEIAFVPNTSFGMNVAALMLSGQGEVVLNECEFPTSTMPWLHHGYKVHFVKPRENVIRLDDIEKALSRCRKGIVVHSHVQYATGFRQDMAALGSQARRKGCYFVANITQSAGAFPVNVKKWGVDIACCTGIKWLCAGEGAGFLYVRRELLRKFKSPLAGWFSVRNPMKMDNRCTDLKDDAARFELGGPALPNIIALGSAVQELRMLQVRSISQRIIELADYLLEELGRIGVMVVSPAEPRWRSGIVLTKVAGAGKIVEALRAKKVLVSKRGGGIRISLHFYNNRGDVDRLVYHLKKLL